MSHSAKVIEISQSEVGRGLITLEVVMPRIILAEFNTHRVFSRNSASSRAIPVEKMIERVERDPYIPDEFLRNQKGMQAGDAIDDQERARCVWRDAADDAVAAARDLLAIGVHKQTTNRLLEPFMWHTVVVTATEWSNFFHLRDNKDAHPDIQKVAKLMARAIDEVEEVSILRAGQWHLPYVYAEDFEEFPMARSLLMPDVEPLVKLSVARCARVSYLTHDGKRDRSADFALFDRLLSSGHMSPFEHVAMATLDPDQWIGNFRGWMQYRKRIAGEDDILRRR